MRTKRAIVAGIALAGATLLGSPSHVEGWTPLGFTLPPSVRHFRVYNNFVDFTANNDTTAQSQFPGYTGAIRACWKGAVEWGSRKHADGFGDACQASLGGQPSNGNLPIGNFDFHFEGSTNTPGGIGSNILSASQTTLGPGVLAVTLSPSAAGWQILFDDPQWTWQGTSQCACFAQFDIQAIAAHELGHGLGLGHTPVGGATMFASAASCSGGGWGLRSIEQDDADGVVGVYGAAAATKPILNPGPNPGGAYSGSPGCGVLALNGSGFGATNNEVWFVLNSVSGGSVKVFNVPSTGGGTQIAVTIPPNAADGDVLVVLSPGTFGQHMSNAQPIDIVAAPPVPPSTSNASPNPIEIFSVPAQTVTLTGTNFSNATQVQVGSAVLTAGAFTIVSCTTITFAMPIVGSLGTNDVTVTNAAGTSAPFRLTVNPVAAPTLDTGSAFGGAGQAFTIDMWGQPGNFEIPTLSTQNFPSTIPGIVSLAIGNNFTNLTILPAVLANAAQGRAQLGPLTIPGGLAGTVFFFQHVEVPPSLAVPYASSNATSKWILF